MEDSFCMRASDTGTATGMMIGSVAGILGGPLGVLLGAGYGALVGATVDSATVLDQLSAVEVLAGKIFEGETAIIALVQEEEPAFDAAFAKYKTTIVRYDAADILDDIDRAYEIQDQMSREAIAQLRADRKAERAERLEERKAALKADFEEYGNSIAKAYGMY